MKKEFGYPLMGLFLFLGLFSIGYFINSGMKAFIERDRIVSVKGLAELEVPADRVIWPLMFKDIGNELGSVYEEVNRKNRAVIDFLVSNGIDRNEITVSAPELVDREAERYSSNNPIPYRYNVTSILTVSSDKVEVVRKLNSQQMTLFKQGIAVTASEYSYKIQYIFTKLNDVKPKMIEEATKNARLAAEKFAKDSDSKLGQIKSASQGQFSIDNRDETTPYIKKIRVVTTVDYSLED